MNVTLFGNEVFADVTKLRCGQTGSGWTLNPVTGILIRRVGVSETEPQKRWPWEDRGEGWKEAATSQGMPGVIRS